MLCFENNLTIAISFGYVILLCFLYKCHCHIPMVFNYSHIPCLFCISVHWRQFINCPVCLFCTGACSRIINLCHISWSFCIALFSIQFSTCSIPVLFPYLYFQNNFIIDISLAYVVLLCFQGNSAASISHDYFVLMFFWDNLITSISFDYFVLTIQSFPYLVVISNCTTRKV